MSQRIHDFIGESLDFLTFDITGASPHAVNDKIDALLTAMSLQVVQKLCNVSLIAAASNRINVMNYIGRAENADLSRFIRENYYVMDHVNFSHLNLFGHMLLAGGLRSKYDFIKEFRAKMGANSIWECNFNRCDLSDARKKILFEKARRFPTDSVMALSRELVIKLATKIARGPRAKGSNVEHAADDNARPMNVPTSTNADIRIDEPVASKDTATAATDVDDSAKLKEVEKLSDTVLDSEKDKKTTADNEAEEERKVEYAAKLASDIAAALKKKEEDRLAMRKRADRIKREKALMAADVTDESAVKKTPVSPTIPDIEPIVQEKVAADFQETAGEEDIKALEDLIGTGEGKIKVKKEKAPKNTDGTRRSNRKKTKDAAAAATDTGMEATSESAAEKRKRTAEEKGSAPKVPRLGDTWK